jgi:PAS domain S-box-containing protein
MIEDLEQRAIEHFLHFGLEDDKELLEIVELASAVANVPYAVITFTDNETVYLKVRKGVTVTSSPRHLSFCTHIVNRDEVIVVKDTLKDERFFDHPKVNGGPGLRFFAGIPILAPNDTKIGSLIVLDTKPHTLDAHQELVLKILGNQVMKIIEVRAGAELLKKKQVELEEQKMLNIQANIRLRSFFESSTNFQVLLNRNAEVLDFNKTAFSFVKAVHKAEMKSGDQFIKYLHPEFVATFIDKYNLTLQGVKSTVEGSTDYAEMGIIWWEATFEAARDTHNEIIGISYIIRNVTERKLKEQKIMAQNDSLLKIAHIQTHQFRAPLTTIMGLMSLIKEENYEAPSEYIDLLEQAVDALDVQVRHIVSDIDNMVIPSYAGAVTPK